MHIFSFVLCLFCNLKLLFLWYAEAEKVSHFINILSATHAVVVAYYFRQIKCLFIPLSAAIKEQ